MSNDEVSRDAALVKRLKNKAQRETNELIKLREAEYVPMWEAIRLRRQQNRFGEEFQIALTRRV